MASQKKVINNVAQIIEHIKDFNDKHDSEVEISANKVMFSPNYHINYIKITIQERTLLINFIENEKQLQLPR